MRNPVTRVLEAVEVELWDPQSPYGTVVSPEERYYRHQPAIVILYDVLDAQSTRLTVGYFDEIQRYCDSSPLILVAATKCDLLYANPGVKRVASWSVDALKACLVQYGSSAEHDILCTMDTSAKDGVRVETAVKRLVRTLWARHLAREKNEPGRRVTACD